MAKKTSKMTLPEFRAKQLLIKTMINNYRMDSCEKESQIALNKREIVKLNQELTELHEQFLKQYDTEDEL